ncbi:MAG: ABC transporter substrate-binding protein [Halobacteriales archaeon]|nr:ABC transporter substrate-binding protein [Halobacteriales archaeon]
MSEISRRKMLRSTGAAGVGAGSLAPLLSGCIDAEGLGAEGMRIGVLQPLSGIVGYWGRMSTFGFVSGLAYRYGEDPIPAEDSGVESDNVVVPEDGETVTFEVEDRTYSLLLRDTEQDAGVAQDAATDLVTNENVEVLFGCISSDATERVIEQVAKQTDTTYIVGASSGIATVGNPDLCGRKIFRANEHTGMEARAEGRYIGQETDTETVYLLGPDNVFGRSFGRMYRRALEENGVEVVGERFVPPDFSEFRGILEDIDDVAQGLGINFTAQTLPNFLPTFVDGNVSGAFDLRGYAAFPGRTAMNLIGNVLKSELGEITEESIESSNIGGLASRYHWNQYDNPINDEFVSSYTEAYDSVPDFFTSGSFAAGYAIAQAVEETGSEDGDDVAEAMYGMTVEETPKGEGGYVFQEHNNQAKSEMTVARIVPNNEPNWNSPIMPSEPVARISADDAVLPEDDPDMNCDLR